MKNAYKFGRVLMCLLVAFTFGIVLVACGAPADVAVDSISLNTTTTTMAVGETLSLVATVSPDNATDKTVTWASSAEQVVTVTENGLVTALAVGSADVTVKSADDETKTAVCHITVIAPYVTVGEGEDATRYADLQTAIDATNETNNTVYLHGNLAVGKTITINKNHALTIIGGDSYSRSVISAADDFDSNCTNLFNVLGSGNVTIKYVRLMANLKCRVMRIANTGDVSLKGVIFTGGQISDVTNWAPGLFITGKSNVELTDCNFFGNKNCDRNLTADTPTKYYATDLWAGSETTVTIGNDCEVGNVVKNANYAGKDGSMLIVNSGSRIDNLFLQYDEYYGETNSIANKGTGIAGAILKLVGGEVRNLHIANEQNVVTTTTDAETGYIYQAGKDKVAIG